MVLTKQKLNEGIFVKTLIYIKLGGKGNCTKRDETTLLHILDDTYDVNETKITMSNVALIRKYDLQDRQPMQCDHDYADMCSITTTHLSEFTAATVSYIAGFVGRMTAKTSWCRECCLSLGSPQHKAHTSFLEAKDRGGLFKPSKSVITICEETEKKIKRLLNTTEGKPPKDIGVNAAIATAVLQDLPLDVIFRDLDDHMKDTAVTDNHVFQLIKLVSKNYCRVRFFHLGKQISADIVKIKVRNKLSKLILFKNQ